MLKAAAGREADYGGDSVTLITHPRRFGKTLNMNLGGFGEFSYENGTEYEQVREWLAKINMTGQYR